MTTEHGELAAQDLEVTTVDQPYDVTEEDLTLVAAACTCTCGLGAELPANQA